MEAVLGTVTLLPWPQVNHFPGTFQIGRKDRLWRNLSKMQARVGKKARNHLLVLVSSVAGCHHCQVLINNGEVFAELLMAEQRT